MTGRVRVTNAAVDAAVLEAGWSWEPDDDLPITPEATMRNVLEAAVPHLEHDVEPAPDGPANLLLVGVSAGHVLVMAPRARLTPQEAREHAAWLVALADVLDPDGEPSFEALLEAARRS